MHADSIIVASVSVGPYEPYLVEEYGSSSGIPEPLSLPLLILPLPWGSREGIQCSSLIWFLSVCPMFARGSLHLLLSAAGSGLINEYCGRH